MSTPNRIRGVEGLTLFDLEAVRLLLRGASVVDWQRLAMRDHEEVDRFLRVNEFDPGNPRDLARLETLRMEAVEYLRRTFSFRIPDDVAEGLPLHELFLLASRKNRRQIYACVVLKVMHIIHHLAGRELVFRSPISDDELFRLVEQKVVRLVEEIRAAGHPIAEFEWSRKPRDSHITKLMAKRSTLAASVYDKLRFRLVVRSEEDLLPLLVEMTQRLIPVNYVVPGESVNDILSFKRVVETHAGLSQVAAEMQEDIEGDAHDPAVRNEFSGPGYRVINFVADLPVRLDHLPGVDDDIEEFGWIAFVLTEFQLLDQRQARENEAGENSHERYKERQLARVKMRLLRGLSERPATQPILPDNHGK